jgi:tetraacyldisaccharide 4'-kinase
MKLPSHPFTLALLACPASLYGILTTLRNRYYDRPGSVRDAGLPVLSVGNLTVGGTGKTPIVSWLAERLLAEGLKPAVVSRGYGGKAGKGPMLVSAGRGPLCASAECGDEPFLLGSRLKGSIVLVGSDRLAGSRAAAHHGAEVVLLDDGFQHRRLKRDLNILLLDADNPIGNGRLLPAGPLREPVSGIGRADVVVLTRMQGETIPPETERLVRRFNSSAPIVRSRHAVVGFFDPHGEPVPAPERAVLFCGIGDPAQFRQSAESLGVDVLAFRHYPDHHLYTTGDLAELRNLVGRGGILITTEKDIARLDWSDSLLRNVPIAVLRVEAEIFEHDLLIRAAMGAIPPHTPSDGKPEYNSNEPE